MAVSNDDDDAFVVAFVVAFVDVSVEVLVVPWVWLLLGACLIDSCHCCCVTLLLLCSQGGTLVAHQEQPSRQKAVSAGRGVRRS